MYCQNCGAPVTGKFCSACGAKVIAPESAEKNLENVVVPESKYEALIKRDDVRNIISKYALQSPHKLTAQDYLKIIDLAYKPIPGISFSSLSETMLPMFEKLGIKTGKSFQQVININTDEVIIKVLCSLAKNGFHLNSVEQANNGIIMHATLPSNFFTWEGDMLLVVEEQNANTKLLIDVKIKGQYYDWGRSKKIITKITDDLAAIKIIVTAGAANEKHYSVLPVNDF